MIFEKGVTNIQADERKRLKNGVQLNPAITDVKGPTNSIHYRRIFIITNNETLRNTHEGTKGLDSLKAEYRYSWIRCSGV